MAAFKELNIIVIIILNVIACLWWLQIKQYYLGNITFWPLILSICTNNIEINITVETYMKYNIVLQNTHSSQKHTCNISNFYTHMMHVVTHQLYCGHVRKIWSDLETIRHITRQQQHYNI
jgi:hypothetical protein